MFTFKVNLKGYSYFLKNKDTIIPLKFCINCIETNFLKEKKINDIPAFLIFLKRSNDSRFEKFSAT